MGLRALSHAAMTSEPLPRPLWAPVPGVVSCSEELVLEEPVMQEDGWVLHNPPVARVANYRPS